MGRVKEELLKREYEQMNKNENNNISEYLLTMDSEFKPEAYEQDNYYLLKYSILDLRSLEPITISEKVRQDQLEQVIPKQLAKIIHETYFSISEYTSLTYKALINNGWLSNQYLFEAIAIKPSISSLDDLVILPSSEKAIIHYLYTISDSLSAISGELYEMRSGTNDSLNNIDKALDLIGYVIQH